MIIFIENFELLTIRVLDGDLTKKLKIISLSNLFFFLLIFLIEVFSLFFPPFTGAELKNTFAHYIIDALKWSVPKHVITV